jgi:surfactin synthase thioesterase subunit
VAFETARALETRGIRPAHLIVSGSRNARGSIPDRGTDLSEMDAATVTRELVALGGTAPDIAADPFFAELVLPYLRSDYRMFQAYSLTLAPPVRCPVTAIVGDRDSDADLRPWSELTTAGYREEVVAGDHFYLIANPPYALLRDALDAAS